METQKRQEIEVKQIKTLIVELRQTKMKCLQLCEQHNKDLNNLQKYQILEVRCNRTVDILDRMGLVNLKHQLALNIAELRQTERDLLYEADKNSFKKTINPPQIRISRQIFPIQDLGPFQIPNYHACIEPNQGKVQRIANFIVQMGRSMSCLRKCILGDWQHDDFYKYQPEYLDVLRQIEQYKMKDQQYIQALQEKFKMQLERLISEGQKVEEGDDYTIVKIPKKKISTYGQRTLQQKFEKARITQSSNGQSYHPHSMIQPKRRTSSKTTNLKKINEQVNNDENEIVNEQILQQGNLDLHTISFQKNTSNIQGQNSKLENSRMDEDQNGNFVYMVKKISPQSQLNSSIISSISSLRSLRKKVFDDDIWDEFQKI